MANHKSAIKRIRSSDARQLRNRYQYKTVRNAVRNLKTLKGKKEAEKELLKIMSMVDKLAKRNIIHKNKAANLKSGLERHVASL